MRRPLLRVQSSSCLTLLGPAAAKQQPSGADATRSVAAHFEMAMGHNVRLALLNQFSPSRAARLACSHSVASRKGAQREVQGYVGLTSLAWRCGPFAAAGQTTSGNVRQSSSCRASKTAFRSHCARPTGRYMSECPAARARASYWFDKRSSCMPERTLPRF